jgi:CRP-like cAMP-binding protein
MSMSAERRAAASARPTWTPRAAADALGTVGLFAGVPARHRQKIARLGVVQYFGPQSEIVTIGTPGDSAYVLLDGACEVVRGAGLPRVEIGSGSIVGEMALLDGAPRSATVVTRTEVNALRLGRTAFVALLRAEPSISIAVIETLGRRLREAELRTGPRDPQNDESDSAIGLS